MTARIGSAALTLAVALVAGTSTFAAEPPAKKPPEQAAADHTYVPTEKRDPFKEVVVTLPPPPPTCGTLCEYDLEQLKVRALATGLTAPLGGVEAPSGTVYVVEKGTLIGKRGGRVVEVGAQGVVVEEPCVKQAGKEKGLCRTTLRIPSEKKSKDENLLRK